MAIIMVLTITLITTVESMPSIEMIETTRIFTEIDKQIKYNNVKRTNQ